MARKQPTRQGLHHRIIQFVEYMVSGGVYFWTGYAAFFVFWSRLHWSLWWAKIIADVVGWVVNYFLQRFWVFSNSSLAEHRVEVTKRYAVITLVDFVLDYVIVRELRVVGITPYLGQFVSAGFFTVWNYAWYRWWVFPESHKLRGRKPGSVAISAAMIAQHVPHRGKGKN
jgi:putative flippase GtrA